MKDMPFDSFKLYMRALEPSMMRNRYWRRCTFRFGHTLPLTMIVSPKYSGSQYGWMVGLSPTCVKWIEPSVLNALSVSISGMSNLPEGRSGAMGRSEEHTSELQSLRHLVCRLLLEKK